ncbi:glucose-1-phosphate cytidylyltransferase [Streptomyces jumonjinensis]|uniref:glucose-1-phosphate cytidylyltransferase n=1 Tax=Streptomyces jumonjinensis TaxID=1945 RepID=UPI003791FA95
MKAVILAGGYGTRLGDATRTRPKPMVEVGGRPILWHIMKMYGAYGITDFVVCCGYKGNSIKDYFAGYSVHESDVTFDLKRGDVEFHRRNGEPWRVTLVDTGEYTKTGGRIKRARDYLDEETFLLTYGDGVASLDISRLVDFHRRQGRMATLTAVRPPGRFGGLELAQGGTRVVAFDEKSRARPQDLLEWVNGGFFVLEPGIFDYLKSDDSVWEHEPLEMLARAGELASFCHEGFWHPMDTPHDRVSLESLWANGEAPWKKW